MSGKVQKSPETSGNLAFPNFSELSRIFPNFPEVSRAPLESGGSRVRCRRGVLETIVRDMCAGRCRCGQVSESQTSAPQKNSQGKAGKCQGTMASSDHQSLFDNQPTGQLRGGEGGKGFRRKRKFLCLFVKAFGFSTGS